MKKILLFFILILSHHVSSQRYVYAYRWHPDSTYLNKVIFDTVALDIEPERIVYFNLKKAKRDSLQISRINKNYRNKGVQFKLKEVKFADHEVVVKPMNISESIHYLSLAGSEIAIKESSKLHWMKLPETKILGGITLAKAQADFGGRIWTAWYDPQKAVSVGPYKFFDTPGLVYELYDTERNHYWKLIASQPIPAIKNGTFTIRQAIDLKIKDYLVQNRQDFYSSYMTFIQDPLKDFRKDYMKMNRDRNVIHQVRINGKLQKMNSYDFLKLLEGLELKKLKEVNNFIEKDLRPRI